MRYKVENSEFQVELFNSIQGGELGCDEHLKNHGFPVIPAVGDEVQYMSFGYWKVVRRVFMNHDGGRVELYLEPADASHAELLRRRAAGLTDE